MTDMTEYRQSPDSIPYRTKLGYSVGNFGFGVVYQVVVSYLVFYTTVILKIPGPVIGVVVAVGVIWDAITDPAMGFISDYTVSSRFGKRHLYILTGGIGIALTNILLWTVDRNLGVTGKVVWIVAALLLVKTALTVYGTPYTALGAELVSDYDGRSSIQGLRTVFFLLGSFTVSFLFLLIFFKASPDFPQGQLDPSAYPRMGVTASAIALVATLTSYFSTIRYAAVSAGTSAASAARAAIAETADGAAVASTVGGRSANGGIKSWILLILRDFRTALHNRNFMFVTAGYLCTNILTAIASSIGLHVYTFTFGLDSRTIALLLGIQFALSIASQPVWVIISKRIDKRPAVLLGLFLCIACMAAFLLLVLFRNDMPDSRMILFILSAILGFGTGGLFSLPLSMVADTVDQEELVTGKRTEGVFYGLQTFSYKIAQSFVIFLIGMLLHIIGFDPDMPVQSARTGTGLGLVLSIGGMAALVLAILAYGRYSLKRDDVRNIQRELGKRRILTGSMQ